MTTMLVASAGGHLTELRVISDLLAIKDRLWVTYDTEMSRSLLADEEVVWARHSPPRDPLGVARDIPLARRALAGREVVAAVSTGASLAVAWLGVARARGAACHYVESAARLEGPSLSMGLCRFIPGVRLYSQSRSWADSRHPYVGSVFDGFSPGRGRSIPEDRPTRVLVTLGTNRSYAFPRLITRLREQLDEQYEVRWQVTEADVGTAPPGARTDVPWRELRQSHEWADVVVAHAGTGSALTALTMGHQPLLIPRREAFHEHVDDHQVEVARLLESRGLARVLSADAVTSADVWHTATQSVVPTARQDALQLPIST